MAHFHSPKLNQTYVDNLRRAINDGGKIVRPNASEIQNDIDTVLKLNPSLAVFPTAGKPDTLYSTVPGDGSGDFTVSRNGTATYFDKDGLLKTAAANEPRFDFDPLTGEYKGLLVEPAATNLLLHSEDFTNSYWPKFSGTLVTKNTNLAPDGTFTANEITIKTSSGNDTLLFRKGFPPQGSLIEVGKTYTFSVWIKSDEPLSLKIDINDSPTFSFTTTSEWVRYSVTRINSTQYQFGDFIDIASMSSQLDKKFYMWGAQLEVGTVVTSYIPTTSSQVTVPHDEITSPLLNYNSGEFSIFVDVEWFNEFTTQGSSWTEILAVPLVWYIRRLNTRTINIWNQNAQQNLGSFTNPIDNKFKILFTFNGNVIRSYCNGSFLRETTPTNVQPYLDFLNNSNNKIRFRGHSNIPNTYTTKYSSVYTRALTNTEAISLTTL